MEKKFNLTQFGMDNVENFKKLRFLKKVLNSFHIGSYCEFGNDDNYEYNIYILEDGSFEVNINDEAIVARNFKSVDKAIEYLINSLNIDENKIKIINKIISSGEENFTLMTDFYELTMGQTFFNDGRKDEIAYFDAFFRNIPFNSGYALMGGLDDVIKYINSIKFTDQDIEYLRSLNEYTEDYLEYLRNFKFTGSISAIPDGTPVFGNEPILTVKAPIIEAQIVETALLSYFNAQIKFMTGAKRVVEAAGDIPVADFGARRADGPVAAVMASKCSYIAGCSSTSNTLAGKEYGIKVTGTMAHSSIEAGDTEYEAMLSYAKNHPNNCLLLVDTFNTLKSGIPNAIRVAKEYLIPNGYRLKGVRIDSGDLAYLSKEAKKMLVEAGLDDAKVCLTNGLDPVTIESLIKQGAVIDMIGVGDNISAPKERVGVVYKLVALEKSNVVIPKIKLSDDTAKTINPGLKRVYRFYDKETGFALGDVLALADEFIPNDQFVLINPEDETIQKRIANYEVRELQKTIFENGELVYLDPDVHEKRAYCTAEMKTLYPETKRLDKPNKYYVDLTKELLKLKKELILAHKEEIEKYEERQLVKHA